jgi:DNA ligase D-like protein (predicted 3'-phosphoesterase)
MFPASHAQHFSSALTVDRRKETTHLRRFSHPQDPEGRAMTDALDEYKKKRDFDATPEPSGKARKRTRKAPNADHALQFCIQKHDARRLHYDFRLEIEGTLKSWAMPKGPCLDPQVKRLAMHVEDHPLDYATFEGHIPEGHYGTGDIIVWDRGIWGANIWTIHNLHERLGHLGDDPWQDYAETKQTIHR